MAVQIVNVIPNADKPHVLEVELLDAWTEMEPSADGKEMVPVTRTYAKNVPVRKSKYESLTATGKKNYALECIEYHHPTGADGAQKRAARRATWDEDDKAAEKAKADAAKAEQEAKFLYTATGIVNDKEGNPAGITATVQHHGRIATFAVPYTTDKPTLETALRDAFAKWEEQELAKEALLASLSQTA